MALRRVNRSLQSAICRLSQSLCVETVQSGCTHCVSSSQPKEAPTVATPISPKVPLVSSWLPHQGVNRQHSSRANICTQPGSSWTSTDADSVTQSSDTSSSNAQSAPCNKVHGKQEGPADYAESAYGESDAEQKFETTLLDAALKHVESDGWTMKALQKGANDLNLSPMFGAVCNEKDLVVHFMRSCNQRLTEKLETAGAQFHEKSVPDKIKLAVRWRLEMLPPVINSWPQAMAVMARPENMRAAMTQMVELMLGILNQVEPGVKDKDVVKHSKLFALQAVYISSELYMLTDFSAGYEDTWDALDRRVDDFLALSMGVHQLERSLIETINKLRTFGKP